MNKMTVFGHRVFDPEVFSTKIYDDPSSERARKARYVVDQIANVAFYWPVQALGEWFDNLMSPNID